MKCFVFFFFLEFVIKFIKECVFVVGFVVVGVNSEVLILVKKIGDFIVWLKVRVYIFDGLVKVGRSY